MFLLLAACVPDDVQLAPRVEDIVDTWWETQQEVPFVGAPACGLLRSDGLAFAEGENKYLGPVDWEATGPTTVSFKYQGLKVGELVIDDINPLVVTYSVLGKNGTIEGEPDCSL